MLDFDINKRNQNYKRPNVSSHSDLFENFVSFIEEDVSLDSVCEGFKPIEIKNDNTVYNNSLMFAEALQRAVGIRFPAILEKDNSEIQSSVASELRALGEQVGFNDINTIKSYIKEIVDNKVTRVVVTEDAKLFEKTLNVLASWDQDKYKEKIEESSKMKCLESNFRNSHFGRAVELLESSEAFMYDFGDMDVEDLPNKWSLVEPTDIIKFENKDKDYSIILKMFPDDKYVEVRAYQGLDVVDEQGFDTREKDWISYLGALFDKFPAETEESDGQGGDEEPATGEMPEDEQVDLAKDLSNEGKEKKDKKEEEEDKEDVEEGKVPKDQYKTKAEDMVQDLMEEEKEEAVVKEETAYPKGLKEWHKGSWDKAVLGLKNEGVEEIKDEDVCRKMKEMKGKVKKEDIKETEVVPKIAERPEYKDLMDELSKIVSKHVDIDDVDQKKKEYTIEYIKNNVLDVLQKELGLPEGKVPKDQYKTKPEDMVQDLMEEDSMVTLEVKIKGDIDKIEKALGDKLLSLGDIGFSRQKEGEGVLVVSVGKEKEAQARDILMGQEGVLTVLECAIKEEVDPSSKRALQSSLENVKDMIVDFKGKDYPGDKEALEFLKTVSAEMDSMKDNFKADVEVEESSCDKKEEISEETSTIDPEVASETYASLDKVKKIIDDVKADDLLDIKNVKDYIDNIKGEIKDIEEITGLMPEVEEVNEESSLDPENLKKFLDPWNTLVDSLEANEDMDKYIDEIDMYTDGKFYIQSQENIIEDDLYKALPEVKDFLNKIKELDVQYDVIVDDDVLVISGIVK